MSKILVFAGTTEGRQLAEILDANKIYCDVCVATEYGSQMIKSSEYITVHEGRLNKDEMACLYKELGSEIIVDATHPYAEIVTNTIKESMEGSTIGYLRLLRPSATGLTFAPESKTYKDAKECAEELKKTTGRILLTTGSKELKIFTESPLKERLVVRVLPGMESLKLCYDAGLDGKQIIAMQGPFTMEMNEATLRQYKIEHLVTKESGSNGGFEEKVKAAASSGVKIHVIERPDTESALVNGLSLSEVLAKLSELLAASIKKPALNVALIGIGCGDESLLTKEAVCFIENAKYVFGAKRMLEAVTTSAAKYPFYLKEDIIPKLEDIYEREENADIAVLFSGDTGFYSGAAKLNDALKEDQRFSIKIMPGISSVSYLSSRLGIDWGTAAILSLHGKSEKEWLPVLKASVKENKATFIITSGAKDIRHIGNSLGLKTCDANENHQDNSDASIFVYAGRNLSYPDEEISKLTLEQCKTVEKDGLYAAVIVNSNPVKSTIVPSITDDEFIREKVPMTKEAVRELSVCRLHLKKGDVVYDIGSGTGSIAVQIAALSESVKVYALECNEEAVELINKNKAKFELDNIEVISAMAPEGLDNIEKADCAFIGGTKGNLKAILSKLYEINPSMRVVINAVSLESITEVYSVLSEYKVTNVDITEANISVAKKLGGYNLMQANNPVYIFSFDFCYMP